MLRQLSDGTVLLPGLGCIMFQRHLYRVDCHAWFKTIYEHLISRGENLSVQVHFVNDAQIWLELSTIHVKGYALFDIVALVDRPFTMLIRAYKRRRRLALAMCWSFGAPWLSQLPKDLLPMLI